MMCADCANLDKSKKTYSDNGKHYIYGCKARNCTGRVVGWISSDSELKTMGCSDFAPHQEKKQVSIFEVMQ